MNSGKVKSSDGLIVTTGKSGAVRLRDDSQGLMMPTLKGASMKLSGYSS